MMNHSDKGNTHSNYGHNHNSDEKHSVDHSGHEQMFRRKFWWSLLLSVPVILYSPMIQQWLGFAMPEFAGSGWITPIFAVIVFFSGGLPFLRMAVPELKNRKPGMVMLIAMVGSAGIMVL
ncbi:MAG: hypothetical protein K9N46_16375 [Candidatus Marinimicrobia bacterium]|nr:hypothetical protein [Candidatus Neomarinimicrobiota bacterium]MCF7830330.1 hypothetical protein [Candidatus Neomarinimicrobiota bacterium]MCF7882307.1 hypothetical protein [Candidatus Neomarinimicrobiota bacterium]